MKVPALLIGVLMLFPAAAAADSCEAVTAALLKGVRAPWHSTMTLKVTGKDTKVYEVINTTDKTFQREDKGRWQERLRHFDLDEAQIRRDWANSASCHDAGQETIGGETANVVQQRIKTRYWISQISGLILKSEIIDRPATLTTEYIYANIQAPPVD